MRKAVVLYSGGTDSTVVAALAAQAFDIVHLLTFTRFGIHHPGRSRANVGKLKAKYGPDRFVHRILDIDRLFRKIAYGGYAGCVRRHGFFVLATCALCKVAMHTRALVYALDNEIRMVRDGANKEMKLFPAQTAEGIALIERLYGAFGIRYETPVFDFEPPPGKEFGDLLRERLAPESARRDQSARTTGRTLQELGLADEPDLKGTRADRMMQARCFQLLLPLVLANWVFLPGHSYAEYQERAVAFMRDRVELCLSWVTEYRARPGAGLLASLIE
jgi:predicted subunit of tRNA(5-methylaminomethyl-2-thiouridylate) methyltransferase